MKHESAFKYACVNQNLFLFPTGSGSSDASSEADVE
jgi:hypothetical protein